MTPAEPRYDDVFYKGVYQMEHSDLWPDHELCPKCGLCIKCKDCECDMNAE